MPELPYRLISIPTYHTLNSESFTLVPLEQGSTLGVTVQEKLLEALSKISGGSQESILSGKFQITRLQDGSYLLTLSTE